MNVLPRTLSIAALMSLSLHSLAAKILEVKALIDGMSCEYCAQGLQNKLRHSPAIESVKDVTYADQGSALIALKSSNMLTVAGVDQTLIPLVQQASFTYKGIAQLLARGSFGTDGSGNFFQIADTGEKIYIEDQLPAEKGETTVTLFQTTPQKWSITNKKETK